MIDELIAGSEDKTLQQDLLHEDDDLRQDIHEHRDDDSLAADPELVRSEQSKPSLPTKTSLQLPLPDDMDEEDRDRLTGDNSSLV